MSGYAQRLKSRLIYGPMLDDEPAPKITGVRAVGETLTCVVRGQASFQWTRDGVDIAGETNSVYIVASADIDTEIACTATYVRTATAGTITSVIPAGRIAEITTLYGGRTPVVPQAYFDTVAAQAADPNTHPSLGTATHNAVADGLWSDTATWDTGTLPGAGDKVSIGGTFDVTFDVDLSATPIEFIHVGSKATLRFSRTTPWKLALETLFVHGTCVMGEYNAPIPESATPGEPFGEVIFHQFNNPGTTTKLGAMFCGPLRVHGKVKRQALTAAATIAAGATSASFTGASSAGWRAGDLVLFPATEAAGAALADASYTGPNQFYFPTNGAVIKSTNFGGGTAQSENGVASPGFRLSQDEVRTIVSIVGDTITWDTALTYDHKAYSTTLPRGDAVDFKPKVAILSRSIRFRSADTSERAHVMCMHDDDQMIDHVELKDMGRSTTDPSLVIPGGSNLTDTNGGTVITNADNVRGRYPLHFHWNGAFLGRRTVRASNVVVWSDPAGPPSPGWGGIVHHGARADISNCTIYNFRGAGLVTELGNEIGQWIGNIICWGRGDGYGYGLFYDTRAELYSNHNGHAGVGMECQSRNILCQNNLVTSCNFGAVYLQQHTDYLNRIPDEYSLRYFDPISKGHGSGGGNDYRETYGQETAQIPDWDDNQFFGVATVFSAAHREYTERIDNTPMVARRMLAINCDRAVNIPHYTFNYSFYDFWFKGNGGGTAVSQGNVSWQFNFANGRFEDFATGIADGGNFLNYDGHWIDLDMVSVTTPISGGQLQTINGDPAAHPANGIMGPWTTVSGPDGSGNYQVRTRTWTILDSAVDLPVNTPKSPYGFDGVEPAAMAGSPKPYFYLDPASDVTISSDQSISLKGIVVDNVGVRRAWDYQSAETNLAVVAAKTERIGEFCSADDVVKRNGCWDDGGGVWKSRCWFNDRDRLDGAPFQYSVDLIVTAATLSVRQANDLGAAPASPPASLPLEPEYVANRALTDDTSAIAVTTGAAQSVPENQVLAVTLQCDALHPTWAITGGADQAKFELDASVVPNVLRWAGDGTKDYEAPDDAGGNNVYDVQLTVSDGWRTSTVLNMAVTVTNLADTVVADFTDNFNRAAQNLEASSDWERINGAAGAIAITSNQLHAPGSGIADTIYLAPDTGSPNHRVTFTQNQAFNQIYLLFGYSDANNWYRVNAINTTTVRLSKCVGGVITTVANLPFTYAFGTVVTVELNGGLVTITHGATVLYSASPTSPPPAGTRVGLFRAGNLSQGASFDNFHHVAL